MKKKKNKKKHGKDELHNRISGCCPEDGILKSLIYIYLIIKLISLYRQIAYSLETSTVQITLYLSQHQLACTIAKLTKKKIEKKRM